MVGGGPGRIDGLLVIMLRMQFDLAGLPGTDADRTSARDLLYQKVTTWFDQRLNYKRTANFQVCAGTRGDPCFDRCLLHFVPCFTTVGIGGVGGSSAASLDSDSPHHLRVTLTTASPPVASPMLDSWTSASPPPGARSLVLRVPNDLPTDVPNRDARLNTCRDLVFQYGCETLGLNHLGPPQAGSYQTPASFVSMVRTVMDGTAPSPPDPVIS
jgi:hypothetical protein